MYLFNTPNIPGVEYRLITLVKGNIVQSKHIGKDIGASFKTLVGGEIRGYTEMLTEAREIATQRMIAEAEKYGADAIINVKYSSASIMAGAAEVIAYGTAVKYIK